ncbi:MAG TPA: histidine kinase dimerization/phospho-acceptor domain-containing protein [Rariglobus sp.]
MKSLRWRFALWFTLSLLGVMAVFVGVTYLHLRHELRVERWERAHPDHKDWTLHGSYSEAEVEDIAGELWRLALIYAAPVTLLTLGAGYYLAKRSFQPVAEMNRQLQEIGAHSLNQRVQLKQADEEFRAIENNINALLARLDGSFRQLSEFSAQVAHELRTPLTLMRLQVEEAAGRIEPALAESLQDELCRLSDYVAQCLLLATAEQGRLTLDIKPVPLRALVGEMIEIYALLAQAENRELTVVAAEEISVEVDARTLRQMLHNLLTNALRHGAGALTVTIAREGNGTICRVENRVASKPAATTGESTALGLRIVRAIVALQPQIVFSAGKSGGYYRAELRWGG